MIAYFTRSGNAEKISDMIQNKTGGTRFKIETVKTYPEDYSGVLLEAAITLVMAKEIIYQSVDYLGIGSSSALKCFMSNSKAPVSSYISLFTASMMLYPDSRCYVINRQ